MPHNARMGKHTGVAAEPGKSGRAMSSIIGIVVTFAAWAALVYYAIQLGSDVRAGNGSAWALLAIAVVGAVCCLFLSLLLGARVVESARTRRAERPPRVAGGRRAKR